MFNMKLVQIKFEMGFSLLQTIVPSRQHCVLMLVTTNLIHVIVDSYVIKICHCYHEEVT